MPGILKEKKVKLLVNFGLSKGVQMLVSSNMSALEIPNSMSGCWCCLAG